MPPFINDALSLLLTAGCIGAVIFLYRRGVASRQSLRGKRQIDE